MRYYQNFKDKWWFLPVLVLAFLLVLLFVLMPYLKKEKTTIDIGYKEQYEKYKRDSIKHTELMQKINMINRQIEKQIGGYLQSIDNQNLIIDELRTENNKIQNERSDIRDSIYNLNATQLQSAFADYFDRHGIR